MSVPAPPYGSLAPLPGRARLMSSSGTVRVALGLLAGSGLMMYAAWLTIAGVTTGGGAVQHIATAPPVPAAPAPEGSAVAFDQVWTSSDGNTIVAGEPTIGTSGSELHPGAPVIRVAVTLTNNGDREWSPALATFSGTLDRAPVPESDEGDWNYSTPIVPRTSVTLSKVFLGDSGQFTLAVHTQQGVAAFTGQV
ncbi:MAG: hypothetical protein ACRDRP_23310 [Pseudonocardiaceae bacterium]